MFPVSFLLLGIMNYESFMLRTFCRYKVSYQQCKHFHKGSFKGTYERNETRRKYFSRMEFDRTIEIKPNVTCKSQKVAFVFFSFFFFFSRWLQSVLFSNRCVLHCCAHAPNCPGKSRIRVISVRFIQSRRQSSVYCISE